jgi:hypothetical protein
VSWPPDPISDAEVERLVRSLRAKAKAFHDAPEPVRTHLRQVKCTDRPQMVYADPAATIDPLCGGCRWARIRTD